MAKALVGFVVCGSLLLGGAAHADGSPGPGYELGVFAGTHLWNPEGGVGRPNADPSSQVQHGGLLGLRFATVLHPRFSLEAELGLSLSNTVGGPANPKFDASARVLGIGYRAQGVFHILTGRVRPYLLAGIGGFSTTSSNTALFMADTTYSAAAGGGLKVDIGPNYGLRLDGRALLQKGMVGGAAVAPNGEISLAFYGRFGKVVAPPDAGVPGVADRDKDGITDAVDLCPDVAGVPAFRGCPEPQAVPTPDYVAPTPMPAPPPLPPGPGPRGDRPTPPAAPPPAAPPPAAPPPAAPPPATPPVWGPGSGTPIP